MRRGVVPELLHERVVFDRLLDDPALDASAPAMNQPDVAHPCFVRGSDVLIDHGGDIPGREGVQVELRCDGDDRQVRHRCVGAGVCSPDSGLRTS